MITITDDLERSNSRLQTPRILSAHSGHKLPLKTDRKLYIVHVYMGSEIISLDLTLVGLKDQILQELAKKY